MDLLGELSGVKLAVGVFLRGFPQLTHPPVDSAVQVRGDIGADPFQIPDDAVVLEQILARQRRYEENQKDGRQAAGHDFEDEDEIAIQAGHNLEAPLKTGVTSDSDITISYLTK